MKKDSYFLDNRRIRKSDFFKLLELPWISVTQSIYIVPQGNAKRLAMITNEARLEILEESARYSYFKERNKLIYQLKEQSNGEIQFFADILKNFDENLENLSINVNDLREYNRLKKQVDTTTRIVANRQLTKIENVFRKWDQNLKEKREKRIILNNDFCAAVKKDEKLSRTLKYLEDKLEMIKKEKQDFSAKDKSYKGSELGIKNMRKELEKQLKKIEENETQVEDDLENLNKKIIGFENELAMNIPKYEKAVEELENIKRKLALREEQVKEIYARKGRGHHFSNKVERDNWIKNELSVLEVETTESVTELEEFNKQIEIDEKKKANCESKIKTLEDEIALQWKKMKSNSDAIDNLIKEKTDHSNELENLLNRRNETEKDLSEIESELADVQEKFRRLLPKKIFDAIGSIQRVIEVLRDRDENVQGYYGLLVDVFHIIKQETYLAIESVAGNRLFHHVVETENLATKIIDEMNKLDLPGEANFFPLSRLRYSRVQETPDMVVEMLSCLEYDQIFDGAIRHVFGKKWICSNLEVAQRIATEYKVDCITLDGDIVFSTGNMCGGSHDSQYLRLSVYQRKKEWEKIVEIRRTELDSIQEQINQVNQAKIAIENKILTPKIKRAEDLLKKMKIDLDSENTELTFILQRLAQQKKIKDLLELKLKMLKSQTTSLHQDLDEELNSQMTEEEENFMRDLQDEIVALRKQRSEKVKLLNSLKAVKEMENILNDKLRKEAEDLKERKECFTILKEELKQDIGNLTSRLIDFQVHAPFQSEIQKLDQALRMVKNERNDVKLELNKVKPNRQKLEKELRILDNELAEIDLKIKELDDQKSKCEDEIRSASFTRSVARNLELPTRELLKQLEKSKKKLGKIKLKPRAQELHSEVSQFKEILRTDIESVKLTEDFEEVMSLNKDFATEVLEEEFIKVSQYFDEYFKRFLPEGSGELVKCEAGLEVGEDTFTGIGVKVAFPDREAENLTALSGGEKSIVSLALIFAFAKSNPPPFFIFDEVEAALSEQNVAILSRIVKEISRRIQVFISTHNRRMMERGDQYFKITSVNGVAHIEPVSSVEELLN